MPDRLKDKVALVAGAGAIGPGWGNGKATAVTCAREGAKVFCADVNLAAAQETADIITGEGGDGRAFAADVTSAADGGAGWGLVALACARINRKIQAYSFRRARLGANRRRVGGRTRLLGARINRRIQIFCLRGGLR
jgi:NAD(P)-dependent dehydrogenase (short-subunit alcohol dehydrogenase family)